MVEARSVGTAKYGKTPKFRFRVTQDLGNAAYTNWLLNTYPAACGAMPKPDKVGDVVEAVLRLAWLQDEYLQMMNLLNETFLYDADILGIESWKPETKVTWKCLGIFQTQKPRISRSKGATGANSAATQHPAKAPSQMWEAANAVGQAKQQSTLWEKQQVEGPRKT